MWGRAAVLQPVVRAVVAVLISVLLAMSGSASAGMEQVSVREEVPASVSLEDGSSDECAACAPEQRIPRPGRVGRPAGRRTRPPAFAPAAGEAGGLSGRQAPSHSGEAVGPAPARHSVLRC